MTQVTYERCDICGKRFAGFTEGQAKQQLAVHKLCRHEGKGHRVGPQDKAKDRALKRGVVG